MKQRIYFYANCGDMNKPPLGGGEAGNRRTLALLNKMGYDVVHIEKYHTISKNLPIVLKTIFLLFIVGFNLFKYFIILLFGRRDQSYVHISGFYGAMVYFERTLVRIAKLLGYKVVYEMRGGGASLYYQKNGCKYRKAFSSIINSSDCIFSQGKENYPLIQSINRNKRIYYYANYVMDDFLPSHCPAKPQDIINVFYFGRISPNKNIDMMIDAVKQLKANNLNVHFTMVGNFRTVEYGKHLKQRIKAESLDDFVVIKPACIHEELKEYLKVQHFFIFPSKEPREGHSNSLTEAMAWGVIPISTNHGFSRSVIGNDKLVFDKLTADIITDLIKTIVIDDKVENLSKMFYNRVLDNYTESIAYTKLKDEYNQLFEVF